MLKSHRRLAVAFLLSASLAAGTASAQDTNTVGPPQLRDFTLPGTRTTTAPPVQQPAPTATPAPRPAPVPPTRTVPAARTPAFRAERPRAVPTRRTAPATAVPVPQAQLPATTPPPATTQAPAPAPPPPASVPQQAPAPVEAPPPPQPAEGGFPWLWLAVALVALGGGAFAFLRFRRWREEEDLDDRSALAASVLAPPPAPAEPVAEPAPAPPPPSPTSPRALMEVDIRPERAAATDKDAVIHYDLTLTNRGDAAAGNIRIDGRMFNANADGAVDAFFQAPIHETSGSPHIFLQPGQSMTLQGQIGMPRSDVAPIEVQGRTIFVPLVAINVAYDWEGGTGRTSTSWVVGREPSSPSARMGAFRLDLGPRVYRQVDRREAKKRVV